MTGSHDRLDLPRSGAPANRLFFLSREQSRSYLKWARRFAQAEGFLLIFASSMTMLRTGVWSDRIAYTALAAGALTFFLGNRVGAGSISASAILFAIAVLRGLATLYGTNPDLLTPFPFLTLLALYVYGQGVRGAVALSRPYYTSPAHLAATASTRQRRAELGARIGDLWKNAGEYKSNLDIPRYESKVSWGRNPVLDYFTALVVGVRSGIWVTAHIPSGEGLMGALEVLLALLGLVNLILLATMLYAARRGRQGSVWGWRIRTMVYLIYFTEIGIWINAVF